MILQIKYFFIHIYKVILDCFKMYYGFLMHREGLYTVGEKNIYLMDIPNHGNLGDQAIVYAEKKYLSEKFPEYKIIEVPTDLVSTRILNIKRQCKEEDLFFLHGGGNFGDEYISSERARRIVIRKIKEKPIIMFPQTIDFSDTHWGKYQLIRSKKIYSKNKGLILTARETVSYKKMVKCFKNDVLLSPDIVLYLERISNTKQEDRQGVLVCFRDDVESIIDENVKKDFINLCKKEFGYTYVTDTVLPEKVYEDKREKKLTEKWSEFSSAEVVITDRLHGMIFAAITETPCLVIPNYNHKIEGTYDWLRDLEYIHFVSDLDEVKSCVSKLSDENAVFIPLKQEFENYTQKLYQFISSYR